MDNRERIAEMLGDPSVRVFAFDPLGAASVRFPDWLDVSADQIFETDGPLDHLAPESFGSAVVAFESSRRAGRGTAHIQLKGSEDQWWLEVFDLVESDNCFIGAVAPDTSVSVRGRAATTIAPRSAEYLLTHSGVILSITPDFTEMLGWTADELVGESSMGLLHPDECEAGLVAWIEVLDSPGTVTRIRQRFKKKDGSWLWCESTDHNELDDPDSPRVRSEILDVSREAAAESALQRRETVLDRLYRALPTGVVVLDPDGNVVTENDRWRELTGAPAEAGLELLLQRVSDRDTVTMALLEATENGADNDVAIDLRGDGACRHGVLHIRPLQELDQYVGLLVTLDDTTEQRIQAAAITAQMRLDPLTGALNRRGLDDVLTEQLGTDRDLAVLYLDLDDFKSINDTYGHARGDQVLREVTACIEGNVPEGTIIARMGGDEFLVVLMDDIATIDQITDHISSGVADLRETFAPHTDFGVSIGHAHRRDLDDFDSLIARADGAMYALKPRRRRLGDAGDASMATQHAVPATAPPAAALPG